MDYKGTAVRDILNQKGLNLPDWTTIYGMEGDDEIEVNLGVANGGQGNDIIIGDSLFSTVGYFGAPKGVDADLSTGRVQDGYGTTDTLININRVQGSGQGDTFKGNSQNNQFWSSSALDYVEGGGGIDQVIISLSSNRLFPAITKNSDITRIEYIDDYLITRVIICTAIEVLKIYRGNNIFEEWDLTGANIRKIPDPASLFEPIPNLPVSPQWKIGKWGIEKLTITEDVGVWYYPTSTDFHPAGNLSIDMHNVALGDFNGDGYQDLLITWVYFPHVIPHDSEPRPSIIWGSAAGLVDGGQSPFPSSATRHQGYRTFKANLNGDGVDDFVTGAMIDPEWTDASHTKYASMSEPALAVLGNKLGQFTDISNHLEGQSLTTGIPNSIFDHSTAVGDLNKDGIDDIFSGDTLWISDGKGNWSDMTSKVSALLPNGSPMSLAIGDLNKDGVNDILTLYPDFHPDRKILINDENSLLNFRVLDLPVGLYGANTKDNFAIIADLNYDGLNDIVVSETRALPYYIGNALQVLIQQNNGAFIDETNTRINNAPRDQVEGESNLFFLDANGDGFGDIISSATSSSGGGFAIFLNDRQGNFSLYDNRLIPFIKTSQLDGFQNGDRDADVLPNMRAYPVDDNHDGIIDLLVQAIKPNTNSDPNQDVQLALYSIISTGVEFGRGLNESLVGSRFDDRIFGLGGDDTIKGEAGNDTIDGGTGIDYCVYSSIRSTYKIAKTSSGFSVSSTLDGIDILTNVERLKFADTAIAFDTSGVGGQAYRVYKAAFNRTPDVGGLGFWISGMDGGASLSAVAQGFVNSAEFKAVYGASPTNAQIVTRFYDNVLGRAAESGGYNYWLGVLDSGNANVAQVLASFSESAENQAAVIGVIDNGILYTPYG